MTSAYGWSLGIRRSLVVLTDDRTFEDTLDFTELIDERRMARSHSSRIKCSTI
jgi:hypothetical protein